MNSLSRKTPSTRTSQVSTFSSTPRSRQEEWPGCQSSQSGLPSVIVNKQKYINSDVSLVKRPASSLRPQPSRKRLPSVLPNQNRSRRGEGSRTPDSCQPLFSGVAHLGCRLHLALAGGGGRRGRGGRCVRRLPKALSVVREKARAEPARRHGQGHRVGGVPVCAEPGRVAATPRWGTGR